MLKVRAGRVACPATVQIAVTYRANVTFVLCEDTNHIVLLLLRTPTSGSDMSISYLNEATPVIKGHRSGIVRDAKNTSVPVCTKLTVPFAHATVGVTPLHVCMASAIMYSWRDYLPMTVSCRPQMDLYMESMTVETIATVGMYWWSWPRRDETITHLRYSRFPKKVFTSKTTVLASSLPPTSSSAKYHSFRAYYDSYTQLAEND